MLKEKTNPKLVDTIHALNRAGRENEAPVWRDIADRLERPSRSWPVVNAGELQRVADDDAELVAVPGKVLGSGYLDRELTVAAWKFSGQAREKIEDAGGRCLSLTEAIEEHASGAHVQVVG